MVDINLITYNVRGLRDAKKGREVFHYLHLKNYIICLQETNSTKNVSNYGKLNGEEILSSIMEYPMPGA